MIPNSPHTLRVLVVDDEPLIRWSLAETRLAVAKTPAPDVVLLDFRLPDSNDLGLLRAIRHDAPHSQIILMTAHGTPEMTRDALALGAYRVVSKPFAVQELAALVSEAHAAAR